MLKFPPSLKPSTQKALSLAAYLKAVEKDCEHLRANLQKAEEEVSFGHFFSGFLLCETIFGSNDSLFMLVMQVKLLYEDNMLLDEENKRLLKRHQEDIIQHSGDKQANSGSAAKVRLINFLVPFNKYSDFSSFSLFSKLYFPVLIIYASIFYGKLRLKFHKTMKKQRKHRCN